MGDEESESVLDVGADVVGRMWDATKNVAGGVVESQVGVLEGMAGGFVGIAGDIASAVGADDTAAGINEVANTVMDDGGSRVREANADFQEAWDDITTSNPE